MENVKIKVLFSFIPCDEDQKIEVSVYISGSDYSFVCQGVRYIQFEDESLKVDGTLDKITELIGDIKAIIHEIDCVEPFEIKVFDRYLQLFRDNASIGRIEGEIAHCFKIK